MLTIRPIFTSNTIFRLRQEMTIRVGNYTKPKQVILRNKEISSTICRYIFSSNGIWEDKLSTDLLKEIELYWKPKISNEIKSASQNVSNSSNDIPKDTSHDFYVLSMFPYPSGQLHMGHVRVYSISDAMAHYYRMSGPFNVLHPMGWDAFGLPAENAAIERNLKPQDWTTANISKMKEQLDQCGFIFDWDREICTSDPLYYKWTQWIFLKMYEAGLAYQKVAVVNWDPIDRTVLADEQVDSEGRSWRSGAKVEKRNLNQWFLRTTDFSKDLYDGLDDPLLKDWRDIKKIQQHWIGECNGVKFHFAICDARDKWTKPNKTIHDKQSISVWTDTPELVLGVSFICISSDHPMAVAPTCQDKQFSVKDHQFYQMQNVRAINPFSNDETPIPIVVNLSNESPTDKNEPSELFAEGSDSFIGIPHVSENHKEIMRNIDKNHELKSFLSVDGRYENCSQVFNGLLAKAEGKEAVITYARENKLGGYWTSSKLQDWPISRQRYWGTPIPMIKCSKGCGYVPVPEESLPVLLPDLDAIKSESASSAKCDATNNEVPELEGGGSPLLQATEWITTDCPKCGEPGAKRETDTLDTFVDSSWYFLRYIDPHNPDRITKSFGSDKSKDAVKSEMPVDLYIGGKEHATLHLYFARFVTHFLHSIGISPVKEPFKALLVQGMVKGKSYRIKGSGKYIPPSQVEYIKTGDKEKELAVDRSSQKPLVVDWEKMSKSKYNGADPNEVLEKYGMDTTRLLILSDVSPLSDRKWDPEDSHVRIHNMQYKLLRLVNIAIDSSDPTSNKYTRDLKDKDIDQISKGTQKLWDARNFYVRGANNAYSETRNLSMVMARVQGLLSELSGGAAIPSLSSSVQYYKGLATAIILLTPLAPHFCAEMWAGLAYSANRHKSNQNNKSDIDDIFQWNKSVFHQSWPKLDQNYNLKLHILRNGKELDTIPIAVWRFNDLTRDDALNIACCVDVVQENILPHQESMKYNFTLQPDYEASIDFRIKEAPMTDEEKNRIKAAKKEEKQAKKLAREARIAQRDNAQKRKKEEGI